MRCLIQSHHDRVEDGPDRESSCAPREEQESQSLTGVLRGLVRRGCIAVRALENQGFRPRCQVLH